MVSPRLVQPARRVLPDGVPQPVARLAEHLVDPPPVTCPPGRRPGRGWHQPECPHRRTPARPSQRPPANTASRRSSTCSTPVSRSWLQSMVARRVRCGGGRVRGEQPEPVREPLGDLLTDSARTRAAASSMASGRAPGTARPTAPTLAGPMVKPGSAAAPVGEQPDRLAAPGVLGRLHRAETPARPTAVARPDGFRGHRSVTAGGDHTALARRPAGGGTPWRTRRSGARSCRGPAAGTARPPRRRACPAAGGPAPRQRRRHRKTTRSGCHRSPRSTTTPSGNAAATVAAAPAGSSDATPPAERQRPGYAQQLARLRELALAAHEVVRFLGPRTVTACGCPAS